MIDSVDFFIASKSGVLFYDDQAPAVDGKERRQVGFRYIPQKDGKPAIWLRQGCEEGCDELRVRMNVSGVFNTKEGCPQRLILQTEDFRLGEPAYERGLQFLEIQPEQGSTNWKNTTFYRGPSARDFQAASLAKVMIYEGDQTRKISEDEVGRMISDVSGESLRFRRAESPLGKPRILDVFKTVENCYRRAWGGLMEGRFDQTLEKLEYYWNDIVGIAAKAGMFSEHSEPC